MKVRMAALTLPRSIQYCFLSISFLISSACVALPDSARDVFEADESSLSNSYKKGAE